MYMYVYPNVSGDEFTLEKIIEIGLDQFSEVIGEISSAASKELAIEQAIADIANQWQDFRLDVGAYKERGHFRLKWDTCTFYNGVHEHALMK